MEVRIRDYRGYGNVPKPLLPMIAVPTTAANGSEAQGNAAIADPDSRSKMICGDPKIFYRTAILDPKLTLGQTAAATAANGYVAISNAVETLLSTRRTPISECFSREAWRLLNASFARVVRVPGRSGSAFRQCCWAHTSPGWRLNTRRSDRPTPARNRWSRITTLPPAPPWRWCWLPRSNGSSKARICIPRLRELAAIAELPQSLRDTPVPEQALPRLADEAAAQWSGRFSSRHFDAAAALEIYRAAF